MFKIEEAKTLEEVDFITSKIKYCNESHGAKKDRDFSFVVKDENNKDIVSGIVGCIFFHIAYIDYIWTNKEYRKKGLATKLLKKVEKLAEKNNCKYIMLKAMDYQTPDFYKKQGFDMVFELEGHEDDCKLYTFVKKIKN